MSETKQNSNAVETQPLIIVKQKSALVGFLLAFIGLGWFGIDRFYKGDKWLGLLKFVSSINCIVGWFVGLEFALFALFHMFIWWPADFILVPLGIVIDNKRKLAKANAVEIK